jgi:hypothetical protein
VPVPDPDRLDADPRLPELVEAGPPPKMLTFEYSCSIRGS